MRSPRVAHPNGSPPTGPRRVDEGRGRHSGHLGGSGRTGSCPAPAFTADLVVDHYRTRTDRRPAPASTLKGHQPAGTTGHSHSQESA